MMEDIISGQNNLRNALTSCDDPLKAIEAFQVCEFNNSLIFNKNISVFQATKWNCFTLIKADVATAGSSRNTTTRLSYVNSRGAT